MRVVVVRVVLAGGGVGVGVGAVGGTKVVEGGLG